MNENKEVTSAVTKRACFHCGSNKNHDYKKCSASSLTCYSCGSKGHISRACSRRKSSRFQSPTKRENSAAISNLDWIYSVQGCSNLVQWNDNGTKGVTLCEINSKVYKTLIDTGSTKSYVNQSISKTFGIKSSSVTFEVDMAQASRKITIDKCCTVGVTLLNRVYSNITLYVMKNLCVDIILGMDFLGLHKRVIFEFDGLMNDLIISKSNKCAVLASKVKSPSLFAHLRSGWKPVCTKSRRFNIRDARFIKSTVEKWKQDKTVRLSRSPWRAQCVVVKRDGEPQRLAIDYSQTINLYTEKDAFPIPLIEDIVNKLAVYKFFRLF